MIHWGSMPANDSTTGLLALLGRTEWSGSTAGERIKNALRPLIDHPDETIRMLVSPALPAFVTGTAELKVQLARRLAKETEPGVRGRLMQTLGALPASDIDDVLAELSASGSWPMLSLDPEPASVDPDGEDVDLDDFIIRLLITLDVIHRQPFAASLLDGWMCRPLDHPKRASRTCTMLRDYLKLERQQSVRAFALLSAPLPALTEAWLAAVTPTAGADPPTERARRRVRNAVDVSDSIARELYFASGAQKYDGDNAQPATQVFAEQAFPVLESLAAISYPAVVQHTVETLAHLVEHDRKRAFLTIAQAASPQHGYQWERQGADTIVEIIDLYAAEHRDLLLSDRQCLTALRRLLESFVRSGWDQAIERAQSINELLS